MTDNSDTDVAEVTVTITATVNRARWAERFRDTDLDQYVQHRAQQLNSSLITDIGGTFTVSIVDGPRTGTTENLFTSDDIVRINLALENVVADVATGLNPAVLTSRVEDAAYAVARIISNGAATPPR